MPSPMSVSPAVPAQSGEYRAHRAITAYVTGGFDGVQRVATLLRGRAYRVRSFTAEVRDDVIESSVSMTVLLTSSECRLLLDRLNRLPAVVAAEHK